MAAERRIIITQSRQVASGTGRNNRPYTIFELEALREDRTPLPDGMKLRAFDDLPVNTPVDVTIEKYSSDKYGDSYTVKLKGGSGVSPQAQINALSERLAEAEDRIRRLAERVYGAHDPADARRAEPPVPAPEPPNAVPGERFGDDIPF